MIINSLNSESKIMNIFKNENDIDESQNDWINQIK